MAHKNYPLLLEKKLIIKNLGRPKPCRVTLTLPFPKKFRPIVLFVLEKLGF